LGNYLIFISTTVSGYEGTGRALSMKLISDMRKRVNNAATDGVVDNRLLKELQLSDPIRYAPGDEIESWLSDLLCLNATNTPVPLSKLPHPNLCELYYVNRDILFSYQKSSEAFLQKLVSLFVSAHYKNQPNDLQLMSDAPGHHIFALCSPGESGATPDILCVIHACEEGNLTPESVTSNLSKGLRPSGDLIPYTLSQYYLESSFANLAGLRVVRIATNPEVQRSGYGSRALQLLREYFTGGMTVPDADGSSHQAPGSLLQPLSTRQPERLDYIGVSFGITTDLFNFWKRNKFSPLYIRQVPNDATGEHSAIMINPISVDIGVLRHLFLKRFLPLLGISFRAMPTDLALSLVSDIDVHSSTALEAVRSTVAGSTVVDGVPQLSVEELGQFLDELDFKRLQMFSSSAVEISVILDLVPKLAFLYFSKRIFKHPDGSDGVILSHAEAAVLLAGGLQGQHLDDLTRSAIFAGVKPQQLRAFFSKAVGRIVNHFARLRSMKARHDPESQSGNETLIRDRQGNVVGLAVEGKKEPQVAIQSALFRDAKGIGSAAGDRPKKKSRK
jgi:N-acetyltransferase 10